MKTTSVERSGSGELSLRGDSARLPAKAVITATAQRTGNAVVSGLGAVEARRDARFGISEGGGGRSVAVLERPVRPAGAFVPPGGSGPVFTLSQPGVVARRDSSHAEQYSGVSPGGVSHPYGDGASDSFKRARGMEDAVRDALGQEADLLQTGMDFEVFRDVLRQQQMQTEAIAETMRGGFSHAVRFASTD